ncbi:coiled-coil domain-containing protein [Holospora undulata]|uniref:Uncharacterized protein n=1 Tax=Holospora undulata HU1 TaxID=1321371 RepID=A0A061JIC2_9PROT|nr:hypothetical protein [Holospora undulata]ETZ05283.1 hypothetical protein K737_300282 [Holospora undulata HU1]
MIKKIDKKLLLFVLALLFISPNQGNTFFLDGLIAIPEDLKSSLDPFLKDLMDPLQLMRKNNPKEPLNEKVEEIIEIINEKAKTPDDIEQILLKIKNEKKNIFKIIEENKKYEKVKKSLQDKDAFFDFFDTLGEGDFLSDLNSFVDFLNVRDQDQDTKEILKEFEDFKKECKKVKKSFLEEGDSKSGSKIKNLILSIKVLSKIEKIYESNLKKQKKTELHDKAVCSCFSSIFSKRKDLSFNEIIEEIRYKYKIEIKFDDILESKFHKSKDISEEKEMFELFLRLSENSFPVYKPQQDDLINLLICSVLREILRDNLNADEKKTLARQLEKNLKSSKLNSFDKFFSQESNEDISFSNEDISTIKTAFSNQLGSLLRNSIQHKNQNASTNIERSKNIIQGKYWQFISRLIQIEGVRSNFLKQTYKILEKIKNTLETRASFIGRNKLSRDENSLEKQQEEIKNAFDSVIYLLNNGKPDKLKNEKNIIENAVKSVIEQTTQLFTQEIEKNEKNIELVNKKIELLKIEKQSNPNEDEEDSSKKITKEKNKEIDAINLNVKKLKQNISFLEKKLVISEQHTKRLEDRNDQLESLVKIYLEQAKDLKNDKEGLLKMIKTLRKNSDLLLEDFKNLKSEIDSLKVSSSESQDLAKRLNKEKEELEIKLKEFSNKEQEIEKEKSQLKKELLKTNQMNTTLKNKLQITEQELKREKINREDLESDLKTQITLVTEMKIKKDETDEKLNQLELLKLSDRKNQEKIKQLNEESKALSFDIEKLSKEIKIKEEKLTQKDEHYHSIISQMEDENKKILLDIKKDFAVKDHTLQKMQQSNVELAEKIQNLQKEKDDLLIEKNSYNEILELKNQELELIKEEMKKAIIENDKKKEIQIKEIIQKKEDEKTHLLKKTDHLSKYQEKLIQKNLELENILEKSRKSIQILEYDNTSLKKEKEKVLKNFELLKEALHKQEIIFKEQFSVVHKENQELKEKIEDQEKILTQLNEQVNTGGQILQQTKEQLEQVLTERDQLLKDKKELEERLNMLKKDKIKSEEGRKIVEEKFKEKNEILEKKLNESIQVLKVQQIIAKEFESTLVLLNPENKEQKNKIKDQENKLKNQEKKMKELEEKIEEDKKKNLSFYNFLSDQKKQEILEQIRRARTYEKSIDQLNLAFENRKNYFEYKEFIPEIYSKVLSFSVPLFKKLIGDLGLVSDLSPPKNILKKMNELLNVVVFPLKNLKTNYLEDQELKKILRHSYFQEFFVKIVIDDFSDNLGRKEDFLLSNIFSSSYPLQWTNWVLNVTLLNDVMFYLEPLSKNDPLSNYIKMFRFRELLKEKYNQFLSSVPFNQENSHIFLKALNLVENIGESSLAKALMEKYNKWASSSAFPEDKLKDSSVIGGALKRSSSTASTASTDSVQDSSVIGGALKRSSSTASTASTDSVQDSSVIGEALKRSSSTASTDSLETSAAVDSLEKIIQKLTQMQNFSGSFKELEILLDETENKIINVFKNRGGEIENIFGKLGRKNYDPLSCIYLKYLDILKDILTDKKKEGIRNSLIKVVSMALTEFPKPSSHFTKKPYLSASKSAVLKKFIEKVYKEHIIPLIQKNEEKWKKENSQGALNFKQVVKESINVLSDFLGNSIKDFWPEGFDNTFPQSDEKSSASINKPAEQQKFISKRVQRAEQTFRDDIIDWVNKLKAPKVSFFSVKNIKEKFSQSVSALKGTKYIDERDEAINKAENKALGDSGSYYGLVDSLCEDDTPINAGVELLKNLDIFVEEQLGNFRTALFSSKNAMGKIFMDRLLHSIKAMYRGVGAEYRSSKEYKKNSPSLYKKMTQFFFSRMMKINTSEQEKSRRLDRYIEKITSFLSEESKNCETCESRDETESTQKIREENSQRVFFAAVSLLIEPFFDRPDFMDILIKTGSEKRILDTFKKIYKKYCISFEYLSDLEKGFGKNIFERTDNKSNGFNELYRFLKYSRKEAYAYAEFIRRNIPGKFPSNLKHHERDLIYFHPVYVP